MLMSEFGIDFKDAGFPDEVAMPEKVELRQWACNYKTRRPIF